MESVVLNQTMDCGKLGDKGEHESLIVKAADKLQAFRIHSDERQKFFPYGLIACGRVQSITMMPDPLPGDISQTHVIFCRQGKKVNDLASFGRITIGLDVDSLCTRQDSGLQGL